MLSHIHNHGVYSRQCIAQLANRLAGYPNAGVDVIRVIWCRSCAQLGTRALGASTAINEGCRDAADSARVLESWKFDPENQSYVSRGRHECGSRASETLAGVADRVREQQSPERACARERGRAWFCVAKRPDEVGVATDWSPRSGDMRSMRAAQRRSRAGAQAPLAPVMSAPSQSALE